MPLENTETELLEGEALQAHVTKLLADHMQDVDKRFSDTMEQLEGLETAFTAKLNAKFQEVLARLPPPPTARAHPPQPTRVAPTLTFLGCAQRILKPPTETLAAGDATGVAAAGTATASVAGATGVTQVRDA
jgi:hypothetical protein